jgi:cell division septum initiation protein DivIVA
MLTTLQEEIKDLQDQKDKLQAEVSGLKQTVDQKFTVRFSISKLDDTDEKKTAKN